MKPENLYEDKTDEFEKNVSKYFFHIWPLHGKNDPEKYFFNFFQVLLKRFKQKSMN